MYSQRQAKLKKIVQNHIIFVMIQDAAWSVYLGGGMSYCHVRLGSAWWSLSIYIGNCSIWMINVWLATCTHSTEHFSSLYTPPPPSPSHTRTPYICLNQGLLHKHISNQLWNTWQPIIYIHIYNARKCVCAV